jgi:Family of unknown function (DUF5719)
MTNVGKARILALATAAAFAGVGLTIERVFAIEESSVEVMTRGVAASMNPGQGAGSLWFCPGVGDATFGPGVLTMTRTQPSRPELRPTASLTVHSPAGVMAKRTITLDAQVVRVDLADFPEIGANDIPSLGATLEISEPGVAVSVVVSKGGGSAAGCSSVVGTDWWLGDGKTTVGSKTALTLYNPFPEAALVDLRFLTERGESRPTELQGIAVAAGSVRVVEVSDYVRRRATVATHVTVRAGRVVAAERLSVQGAGSALVVGSTALAESWFFPASSYGNGRSEQYVLTNPTVDPVEVSLVATLKDGSSEPFSVTVPATGIALFDPAEEGRIGENVEYSLGVSMAEPVPILVTRTSATTSGRKNLESFHGAPEPALRWVVAGSGANGATDLVIMNPYDVATTVSVERVRPGAARLRVWSATIPSGGWIRYEPPKPTGPESALIVRSDRAPVVVQQGAKTEGETSQFSFVDN